jgi:hypothetical protein
LRRARTPSRLAYTGAATRRGGKKGGMSGKRLITPPDPSGDPVTGGKFIIHDSPREQQPLRMSGVQRRKIPGCGQRAAPLSVDARWP